MKSSTLAFGDELAPADHQDVVGGQGHLAHQVARHHDRPTLPGQRAHEIAHPDDALGVQAVHRLVEDEDGWVAEQGGGDTQPLAHAEREPLRPSVGDALEPDQLKHLGTRRVPMPLLCARHSRWSKARRPPWRALASSSAPTSRIGAGRSR